MNTDFAWTPENAARRLEQLHDRLGQDDPVLRHVFTEVFDEQSMTQARQLHGRSTTDGAGSAPSSGVPGDTRISHPLRGALVSVKDLFDVKGYVSAAGSRFMSHCAPAQSDAPAVRRLREAGAIIIGHTSMTELAYSGLGLNPHHGTPDNAIMPGRIPGGSTAGGAVSVALGVADIALGTDTGGSLRIPAAFNGIVGFKPSQSAVSREGCKSLSRSLDSVGPMTASVAACSLAFNCIRDRSEERGSAIDPEFIVPDNYGMDDMEPEVARAFEHAISTLSAGGYIISTRSLASLRSLANLAAWHFAAVESRAEYDEAYRTKLDLFDPRVASRMARADTVTAVEYRKTLNQRERLIGQFRTEMQSKVLLMPTVPILPPPFDELLDDDSYARINTQVLRNPSIANVLNCCSISLPLCVGGITTGLMLTAQANSDQALLDMASRIESLLAS
ncbi:MAG: amidase [Granulosicoccus sp.]|nr:amidase [Granulosicoccus sp.]